MRMCLLIAVMLVGGPRGRGRLQTREVRIDEQMYELCKADGRRPAELRARLRRITHEPVQLGTSALERGIRAHVLLPVETDVVERDLDEIPHRMALARRDDVVVRLVF